MARGYLARSVAGDAEGVLVVDPSWYAETDHHRRCDELAAQGFTALTVELRDERGEPLEDAHAVVVLREGVDYLGFHPSVGGRAVYVEGDTRLVDLALAAIPGLARLAPGPASGRGRSG